MKNITRMLHEMELKGYKRKYNIHNGVGYVYEFENGYGASVVSHDVSYGGDRGLYEIAVLDSKGDLCYDTPITDDVVGYAGVQTVYETLDRIKSL
jgi:hypothetical protein|tara:strand:- start:583 stop:867 length:285 start_codon:yes stop_codon:yes gene_type:complete